MSENSIYTPKPGDFLVQEFLAIQGNLISREQGVPTTPGITMKFKAIDYEEQEINLRIHIHNDVVPLVDLNNHIALAIGVVLEGQQNEIPKNN